MHIAVSWFGLAVPHPGVDLLRSLWRRKEQEMVFCTCIAPFLCLKCSILTTFSREGWLLQVKLIEGYLTRGRGKQTPWIIDGNLSILPLHTHSRSRFIPLAPPIVQSSPLYIHFHCFSFHVLYIQTLSQLYIPAPWQEIHPWAQLFHKQI